VAADRSHDGAIYKGLAISSTPHGDFLYAADFHNARVDVFDSSFNLVTPTGSFVDPNLPEHYAPFGIQNLGGRIFVAYAKQDAEAEDEVAGPGLGFVSMFDADGHFLRRVASHGRLNAPCRQLRRREDQCIHADRDGPVRRPGPASWGRPRADSDRRPLGDRLR
jgi:uncharacterized protein (TIGR03118 family)